MKQKEVATSGLVSVIIPVWNTGECAVKLIQQLIEQPYRPIEVIAIDDGSTDDSLSRLNEAKSLAGADVEIKILSQKNAGAAAARNAGIAASRGEYLIFADSDDEILPDFIDKLVKVMHGNNSTKPALAVTGVRYRKLAKGTAEDVYIAPRRKRHKKERLTDYVIYLMLLDGRMYGTINKMFRAEIVRKKDVKFQVRRDFAEDTQFVLDYLAAEQALRNKGFSDEISFILEPLYVYNFGTTTSTVRKSATIWKNWQQSYRDLSEWAAYVSGVGIKTRFLLWGILLRWRISYARSVKRASEIDLAH